MVSWALHRIAGLGVLIFILLHIIDIFVIGYGPKAFDDLLFLYRSTGFRIGEVVLVAGLYYHAANGVRITIVDFWSKGPKYQQQLFYGVIVVFIAAFVPTAYFMLRPLF